MKVILTENIDSLGQRGEIKDVNDSYAINFLLPQSKVILATQENIIKLQAKKKKQAQQLSVQEALYKKIEQSLNKQSLNFTVKVSSQQALFQNIKTDDIIRAVQNKFHLELHDNWFSSKIILRKTGRHSIILILPNKKTINFFVNIKAL